MPKMVFPSSALRRLACAALVTLVLLSRAAHADDLTTLMTPPAGMPGGFTAEAVAGEKGTYDSNPLMLIGGGKSLYGSVTSPELIINDMTPRTKFVADNTLVENVFNLSDFDSTDVHSKIGIGEQTQTWLAGITTATDYDTTRGSELSNYGINGTNVNKAVRHLGFEASPELAYSPTTVDKVSLLGQWQLSNYESPTFTDYRTETITPTYTHSFDPQNMGTFDVAVQRYNTSTGPSQTTDSVAPAVGWQTQFTQRFTGQATVGLQATHEYGENVSSTPWNISYIYSAQLAYKDEQDNAILSAGRANYPGDNGTQSLLTTIKLTDTHNLNESFAINADGSFQSASYQADSPGSLDTLWTADTGLAYHATDVIDITATYEYRYETLTNTSGNAQDHTVAVGFVYRPKAWSL